MVIALHSQTGWMIVHFHPLIDARPLVGWQEWGPKGLLDHGSHSYMRVRVCICVYVWVYVCVCLFK